MIPEVVGLLVLGLVALAFVTGMLRAHAASHARLRLAVLDLEERIRDEVVTEIATSRASRAVQDAELIAWLMKWTTATRADLQAMTELTEEFRDLAAATFVEGESDDEGKSN